MIYILVPLLILADQLTKIWSFNKFTPGMPEQFVGLGLYFTSVKNTGAAFGILQNNTLALGILSLLVSAFLILFMVKNHNKLNGVSRFALTLILSGAIGNMIDRLYIGFVRDFIHFKMGPFDFPFIFNIADSCVVVGAILLFLANLRSPEAEQVDTAQADMEEQDSSIQNNIHNNVQNSSQVSPFSSGETHPIAQPTVAKADEASL